MGTSTTQDQVRTARGLRGRGSGGGGEHPALGGVWWWWWRGEGGDSEKSACVGSAVERAATSAAVSNQAMSGYKQWFTTECAWGPALLVALLAWGMSCCDRLHSVLLLPPEFSYQPGDWLLFGAETSGLPMQGNKRQDLHLNALFCPGSLHLA